MSTRSVLTTAFAFENWGEVGGDNRGQAVEFFQKFVGIKPGDPWCMAFVMYVGFHGCYDYLTKKSYWPLPRTGGCQYLADWAKQKGIRFLKPQAGDVFLIWFPKLGRFAHTGFIVSVNADGSCDVIEGNTNTDGSRNGWLVARRTRRFTDKDRFVRYKNLFPEARKE